MSTFKQLQVKFTNHPFSLKELKKLGFDQKKINQLLKEEHIFRLRRGIYAVAKSDISDEYQFEAATLRINGPSAVCLASALAFYGLIDEIPKKVWLLVPESKHTAHKDIRLLRRRDPKWKIGIVHQGKYSITNLERSIVEALILKRILGTVGVEALKTALSQKKTTLDRILKIATALKVDHRIMNYIEALA